jgi:hypothetical protein
MRLSRPEKRNAIDGKMVEALRSVFERLPRETCAVVLHGEGNHFRGGADLRELAKHSGLDLTSTAFDEEGFFSAGDAPDWVDDDDPKQGLRYDGRIAEDFKLATGIWVRVGPLRDHLLKHLAPEVRDLVIVGENRSYIAVLAVPATPEIAKSKVARARVLAKLTALAKQAIVVNQLIGISVRNVGRQSFLTLP